MRIDMPSDSGEKLSPSRFGIPRSAGFLMSTGRLRTCSVPKSSDLTLRELQAAQPHLADAGAQGVRDRRGCRSRCAVSRDSTVSSDRCRA